MAYQAGLNVYLRSPGPGGDLRVYRRLGMRAGNTAQSGVAPVGNYDLDHELVEGVAFDTIPARTGDLVIAPNRFLHEVTATARKEEERIAFGVHVLWMLDATLRLFS
jgi:hypothetical protein